MGRLIIHRQIPVGKSGKTHINVGRNGHSLTHKFGRFTWNSKGGLTFHVSKGVSFKIL